MELAPVPRPRPWSWGARTALTALVVAPVLLLVLVPAAFGLERYVMTTDAGDAAPRGSVVLARVVPLSDLEDGDVVTAPSATTGLVSGTVSGAGGAQVAVAVGGGEDDVPLAGSTAARLVLAVPLVGYPFLGGAYTPVLALVALLAGLVLGVVFLRDSWRPPLRAHEVRSAAHTAG